MTSVFHVSHRVLFKEWLSVKALMLILLCDLENIILSVIDSTTKVNVSPASVNLATRFSLAELQ